jgi:hypothetical protein
VAFISWHNNWDFSVRLSFSLSVCLSVRAITFKRFVVEGRWMCLRKTLQTPESRDYDKAFIRHGLDKEQNKEDRGKLPLLPQANSVLRTRWNARTQSERSFWVKRGQALTSTSPVVASGRHPWLHRSPGLPCRKTATVVEQYYAVMPPAKSDGYVRPSGQEMGFQALSSYRYV